MLDLAWTARQRDCIAYTGPHLLVSGPPGTGKTLVLLKRACRFSQVLPCANAWRCCRRFAWRISRRSRPVSMTWTSKVNGALGFC
jgi:DNA polymerase III delta prime subunit